MSKKDNNEGSCKFRSKIGGQALIEGVMMRGIDKSAMACRLPDGTIDVEEWSIRNGKDAPWYLKTPFIRGTFNYVISLRDGYKCLSKSAEKQAVDDEEEEMNKFEKWLTEKMGDKLVPVLTGIASLIGVALSLLLFMYLPAKATGLLRQYVFHDAPAVVEEQSEADIHAPADAVETAVTEALSSDGQQTADSTAKDDSSGSILYTAIEGIIKIALLVGYLAVVSQMKDIKRTFKYHGAEHKTIACYESGEELTVENVKKHTRFHPRCGTSFLLITLLISILVFTVLRLPWAVIWQRVLYKFALLPIIIGISYELIKLAGRYTNPVTKVISAPGLALQRLTTREPDDKQIEIAIAALKPCIPTDRTEDKW